MAFFQLKFLYKKKIVIIIATLYFFNLNAQEENHIKLRIEPGLVLLNDSENLGLLLNIEPKIKVSENIVIGFRFAVALNTEKIKNNNSSQFFIEEQNDNGVISFMPALDYYLNEDNFRPYIGLGIGYYAMSYIDVSRRNGSSKVLKGNLKDKAGVLLRCGFEYRNTRVGLEYNFIPKADIELPDGQIIGTVDTSYLGITIGFVIGGRKN